MFRLNRTNKLRVLAFGILMALVAFTYATNHTGATAANTDAETAAPRLVGGKPLHFTNPLYVTQPPFAGVQLQVFDLGDACFGSTITRYVTAAGGVRPYTYFLGGPVDSDGDGLIDGLDTDGNGVYDANIDLDDDNDGFPDDIDLDDDGDLIADMNDPIDPGLNTTLGFGSSLVLNPAGCLVGSVATSSILTLSQPPRVSFPITVNDSTGSAVQGLSRTFILNMFVCGNQLFRFAMDKINNGVLGLSYIAKLETLGGKGRVRFSVVPGSLAINGVPKSATAGLEAIGLSLADDGTIFGKPLESGQVIFRARAVDQINRIARDRTDTTQDQIVTFNVEDNVTVSSDLALTAVKIKGSVGTLNKDTINFAGLINLRGTSIAALFPGGFTFRIGGATFEGFFNRKGAVTNRTGGPLVFADGSKMKLRIDPQTGTFSGGVTSASISTEIDAPNIVNRTTKRLAISFVLCNKLIASDVIDFSAKRTKDRYTLDFGLGRLGRPLGGTLATTQVSGKDGFTISGLEGDAWKVKFISVPRFGIDENAGLDSVESLTVRIGTGFVHTIPANQLKSSSSGSTTFANTQNKAELVAKLKLNNRKFTGDLQTYPLSENRTGLTQAKRLQATDPDTANFNFGFDVNRTGTNADFTGEIARRIIALQRESKWVDQEDITRE